MISELTVVIKDPEKTLRTKYLSYDKYEVSEHDPYIKDCIEQTLKNFAGQHESIQIKINLEVE